MVVLAGGSWKLTLQTPLVPLPAPVGAAAVAMVRGLLLPPRLLGVAAGGDWVWIVVGGRARGLPLAPMGLPAPPVCTYVCMCVWG